jgi:hypothetical protein
MVYGIMADEAIAVYVGPAEIVRGTKPMSDTWITYPLPFGTNAPLHGVAGLGDGRFLVSGDTGQIAAWNGTRWCVINADVHVALGSISVAPSRRMAYIASDGILGPNDETVLVRVELPPATK